MNDKNVREIIEWREAILKLPDQKFFDLMTFYLGKIDTPFNKQDLIDKLSGFLRKTEVQDKIIIRINSSESYLISCILLAPRANFEFLKNFFANELNHYQVQDLLNNLEQRLIIFKPEVGESYFKVNPYLRPKLSHLINLNVFLTPVKIAEKISKPNLLNSINILSAYSYFSHNPNATKNNGELKKKTFERVENIFVQYSDSLIGFNFLLRAFFNLNLFFDTEKGITENPKAWKQFGTLSSEERRCYIIAAASGNYSEKYLVMLAKTVKSFFDLLNPKHLYEKSDLEKAFALLRENLNVAFLGADIYNPQVQSHETFFNNNEKSIIEIAEIFGTLVGDESYLTLNSNLNEQDVNKTILVSPAFEVTIFPSDNFEKLLPLVSALIPTSVQTTAVFELNRETSGLFFEQKGNYETLKEIFLENITGDLPQNIDISLKQWYQNFSSVKLYEGIVAVVAKEKVSLFEKNMPLENIVEAKLSENVFILRLNNLQDIRDELNRAGLECLVEKEKSGFLPLLNFNLKSFKKIEYPQIFRTLIENNDKDFFKKDLQKKQEESLRLSNEDKKELYEKVKGLTLEKSEKDFLNDQITKNIIFDSSQITSQNIKFDSLQVSALDYSAKLRACENAITQNKKLEITVEVSNKHKTFYCTPLEVKKSGEKDLLKLIIAGTGKIKHLNISKIAKLKILKDTIF